MPELSFFVLLQAEHDQGNVQGSPSRYIQCTLTFYSLNESQDMTLQADEK